MSSDTADRSGLRSLKHPTSFPFYAYNGLQVLQFCGTTLNTFLAVSCMSRDHCPPETGSCVVGRLENVKSLGDGSRNEN